MATASAAENIPEGASLSPAIQGGEPMVMEADLPGTSGTPTRKKAAKAIGARPKFTKASKRDESRRHKVLTKICDKASSSQINYCEAAAPIQVPDQADTTLLRAAHEALPENDIWGPRLPPPSQASAVPVYPPVMPSIPPQAFPAIPGPSQALTVTPFMQDPSGIQAMIAAAIKQGVSECLQSLKGQSVPNTVPAQSAQMGAGGALGQAQSWQTFPQVPYREELRGGQTEEEGGQDLDLSDDEGIPPEPPVVAGLFHPSLFRSLLFKACNAANIGETSPSAPAGATLNPLFSQLTPEAQVIPCPQLFVEAVQGQWQAPGAGPLPSLNDRKLFNVGPDLAKLLNLPTVDPPVAALHSLTTVPGDASDILKPEEKKLEQALLKNHQAAAWAVRAATSASFFTRANLTWLKELQERVPATDVRLLQDISKMLAAARYTADASLQAARFASRAIGASVVARRLHWLRSWQADVRHKGKLASSPFDGQQLFGAALEPLLIEDKDKRKVLPPITRRGSTRPSPLPRRPYRPPAQVPSFPRTQGQYGGRQRFFQDRSSRGRGNKRPFRGGGGRYSRRTK